jgi:hypothetical protein
MINLLLKLFLKKLQKENWIKPLFLALFLKEKENDFFFREYFNTVAAINALLSIFHFSNLSIYI